jgi:hypothetical protein
MDMIEAFFAAILIRAVDVFGYGLGMIALALAMFAAGAVIHYVLKWTGAFKKPPAP